MPGVFRQRTQPQQKQRWVRGGPMVYTQAAGGSLSSAGGAVKRTGKAQAGGLTSGGVLTLIRTFLVTLAGGLTSGGALLRAVSMRAAGALSSSGGLVRRLGKVLSGGLGSIGGLTRRMARALAGVVASAGVLIGTASAYLQSVGGTLTSGGGLVRQAGKWMDGVVIPLGGIGRLLRRALSGLLRTAGALNKSSSAIVVTTPSRVWAVGHEDRVTVIGEEK